MDQTRDRRPGMEPRETAWAPFAALGAVAVAAGVATYLVWPGQRAGAPPRRRQALITYLRDHLSGSDTALRVVDHLGSTEPDAARATLFRRLATEFAEERAIVRTLLTRLGGSERSIKRAAGYASGAVASMSSGGEPGDLSLLRTLEALAIGVQGKRCMWRALQDVRGVSTEIDGMSVIELEAQAVRQWEAIEDHRRALVAPTFAAMD
jgi:hypothetical protein